jgi:hypothetical protein
MSVTRSEQLNELGAALAKAQAQVKGAKKDAANPFFKSTYADLASVWDACREALTSNGLSVVQFPGYENGVATLDTMLLHSSGQWLCATAGAPVGKQDAQGVGSVLTYLRRYALAAVASVSPEDDDGNAASKKSERGGATRQPGGTGAQGAPVAPTPQPLNEKPKALQAPEPPAPWDEPGAKGMPATWRKTWPFGSLKGKELHSLTSDELVAQKAWALKAGKALDLVDTMDEILASRDGE